MENDKPKELSNFELLQKLLRGISELRITDTPFNNLAMIYKEGYETAIDDALNLIRREM